MIIIGIPLCHPLGTPIHLFGCRGFKMPLKHTSSVQRCERSGVSVRRASCAPAMSRFVWMTRGAPFFFLPFWFVDVFFFVWFVSGLVFQKLKNSGCFCCSLESIRRRLFSGVWWWRVFTFFFPTLPLLWGRNTGRHPWKYHRILFKALGGPSVWSWEEDYGRSCGLWKRHCFLFFPSQGVMEVGLERCWSGGRGRLKLDHSERKISSRIFFSLGGMGVIDQWMIFCGCFWHPLVVGLKSSARVYYSVPPNRH